MGRVINHEEIVVDDVVKSLTPAVYDPGTGTPASFAIIHAEGGQMRYFVNGQDPTPSSGALLEDGDIVELPSIYHIKDFRVVKTGSDSGKITATYEA
jgi:hypothetical protein